MGKLTRKVIGQLCASGAIQEDDRELYEYVLNILLTGALHTLTILAIGVALGMFFECLALFISFFLIRKFAGGFHAQKGWQCYLFTIVTISGILLLIKLLLEHSNIVFYVLLTASVLLIFAFSPVDSPNKPFSENEKKVYRLISWGLCCVISALSVALFVWVSRPIGMAIGMGLVLGAFGLILATIEKLLRSRRNSRELSLEGCIAVVELAQKLDAMQELAVEFTGEPHELYLIGLLAEHAEDDEITTEFLKWMRILLHKQDFIEQNMNNR